MKIVDIEKNCESIKKCLLYECEYEDANINGDIWCFYNSLRIENSDDKEIKNKFFAELRKFLLKLQ
jgi:hypothetical protein